MFAWLRNLILNRMSDATDTNVNANRTGEEIETAAGPHCRRRTKARVEKNGRMARRNGKVVCSRGARRKPAPRGHLVARSMGRKMNGMRKESLGRSKGLMRRCKKLQRPYNLKRRCKIITKRQKQKTTDAPNSKTQSNDITADIGTSVISKETRSHFVKNRQEHVVSEASVKEKRKLKRERQSARIADISLGEACPGTHSAAIVDKEGTQSSSRPKQRKRRKVCPPTQAITSISGEWPRLTHSAEAKTSAKDTAEEIVKNKQTGGVTTRQARKRWADVAAGTNTQNDKLHTTKPETTTWALVASGSYKPSEETTVQDSINDEQVTKKIDMASTSNGEDSANKQSTSSTPESSVPTAERIWGSGNKGKGKPQSLKSYRKHFGDGPKSKLKKYSLRGVKKLTAAKCIPNIPNVKEAKVVLSKCHTEGPNTEGTLYQDERATSKNSNGEHKWCIDNMQVVYTQPASNVICLQEPKNQRAKRKGKGENRCNNRSVSVHSQASGSTSCRGIVQGTKKSNKSREQEDSRSDNELSTLLNNVSFQTNTDSTIDKDGQSSELKQGSSHQTVPPHIRYWRQKRQTNSGNRKADGEASNQSKISSRYRALKRKDGSLKKDGNRLDAKSMTEKQTRSRKTDAILESKEYTRSEKRRLRRQRTDKKICAQRTSAQNLKSGSAASFSNQDSTLQNWAGTSKDYMVITNESDKDQKTNGEQPSKEDNRGSNNSFQDDDLAWLGPVLAQISTGLWRPPPVSVKSDPTLSTASELSLNLEQVSEHNLDLAWWNTYLNGSESTTCELVPLPDNMATTTCYQTTVSRCCKSCSDVTGDLQHSEETYSYSLPWNDVSKECVMTIPRPSVSCNDVTQLTQ